MSKIIIPSKNIYKIDNNKVPNNIIDLVNQAYLSHIKENGNVLIKPYTFKFFEYISDSEPIENLWENPENTEGFQFYLTKQSYETLYLSADISIEIGKNTKLSISQNAQGQNYISSHKLIKKSTHYNINDYNYIEKINEIKNPIITSYDEQNGIVTLHYETYAGIAMDEYVLSQQLTLEGEFLSTSTEVVLTGEGTRIYKLEANELVQGQSNMTSIASNILNDYINGKEIIKIRCGINEYYDINGNKMISQDGTNPMAFNIYDEVIPLKKNQYGKDVPISLLDKVAKVFAVVDTEFIFDGAVWQNLTLLETGEGEYIYITDNPYLTFSSEDEFTLSTNNKLRNWDGSLEYSTDTIKWNVWNGKETLYSQNGKLYLRGVGNTKITGQSNDQLKWLLEGTNIHCSGNIETLLDYIAVKEHRQPEMGAYCFSRLFANSESLVTPPSMPSTKLSAYCYDTMYYSCRNLTALPILPATKLVAGCYHYMFEYCDKIKINSTQKLGYVKYRIPVGGNGTATGTSNVAGMFTQTGGDVTGTPSINTTYYTPNKLV